LKVNIKLSFAGRPLSKSIECAEPNFRSSAQFELLESVSETRHEAGQYGIGNPVAYSGEAHGAAEQVR
jgi:hypothetical protein